MPKCDFNKVALHNSSNIGILYPPSLGAKDNSFFSFSVIIIPAALAGKNAVGTTSSTWDFSNIITEFALINHLKTGESSLWFCFCHFS